MFAGNTTPVLRCRAAGGTSPGTDEAGVTVWIPLAYPAVRALTWARLRLAAGHLQGPTRTVTQLWTTSFLWSLQNTQGGGVVRRPVSGRPPASPWCRRP